MYLEKYNVYFLDIPPKTKHRLYFIQFCVTMCICNPDFSKLKCEVEITNDSFPLSQRTHKHCKRYNISITFFLFELRTLLFILPYVTFNV